MKTTTALPIVLPQGRCAVRLSRVAKHMFGKPGGETEWVQAPAVKPPLLRGRDPALVPRRRHECPLE